MQHTFALLRSQAEQLGCRFGTGHLDALGGLPPGRAKECLNPQLAVTGGSSVEGIRIPESWDKKSTPGLPGCSQALTGILPSPTATAAAFVPQDPFAPLQEPYPAWRHRDVLQFSRGVPESYAQFAVSLQQRIVDALVVGWRSEKSRARIAGCRSRFRRRQNEEVNSPDSKPPPKARRSATIQTMRPVIPSIVDQAEWIVTCSVPGDGQSSHFRC
jgi:hypothetical protein